MNVLDLFCGAAGGWSLGLYRAGYTTVAACEINGWRREVFAAQHPGCRMYADVRDLGADHLIRDLGYLPDVVVGSPPCQEISTANCKGTGITDDHLFWEWSRIVFEVRPLWCAAENSPNARLSGIDGILDALDQAGYAAWPCVVGADNAGANHRRKRLWLIAADASRLARLAADAGRERRQQIARGSFGDEGADEGRAAQGDHQFAGEAQGDDPHAEGLRGLGGQQSERGTLARDGFSLATASENCADAQSVGRARSMGCATGRPQERDRPVPPALRDIGRAWPHWNGGLAGLAASCAAAGFGAVDDGPDAGLPAGLRNRAIAALGDAVIPQIPQAIGNAMKDAFV